MPKIITSKDVHLSYGSKEALHGISLDFEEHEITALIGPSGCGKSTYLRCLNRMNDLIKGVKISGSMKLEGKDIYAPNVDIVDLRKRVGMVFQQPNPFPFSVYENVAYGLRLAGEKDKHVLDERVETSLKQAAIWDEVKDHLYDNALSFRVVNNSGSVLPECWLFNQKWFSWMSQPVLWIQFPVPRLRIL